MNRPQTPATDLHDRAAAAPPSWVVGFCGVAAVASVLFSILMFLNR
jgi:hypothetical protein